MANPHWNTTAAQQVRTVYMEVIDNVISNMRQTFLDDGTDEQVLQDLKAAWMLKLEQANTLVPLHNPLAKPEESGAAASGGSFYPHNASSASAAPQPAAAAKQEAAAVKQEAAAAKQEAAAKPEHPEEKADAGPPSALPQTDGADGSGEEELNSQDEESGEESEGEEGSANFIICQWDKINRRNRSRWRANLRHGIMQIDGKEFMFQKLTGEYDW